MSDPHRADGTPGEALPRYPVDSRAADGSLATTPAIADFASSVRKRRVVAWAMWDWGSASFNAVATTFVFATYLASSVAEHGRPADALPSSTYIAIGSLCAGVIIALLAPVMGQRTDAGGHRKRNLLIFTAIVVACMYGMFFVRNEFSYLLLGLLLLNVGAVFSEFGGVSYNAMLSQVATPATAGRISGLGWGSGYVGGIVLLLICYFGFIAPDVGLFGVTSAGGLDVRVTMVVAATWFALSAIPLFISVPEVPAVPGRERRGLLASYAQLGRDLADLWRHDRNAVRFLIASALYRDGLAAVFSFGAVFAATVWGLSSSQVILFGIAANVVAAAGAALGGLLDDAVGPRTIVLVSLIGLVASATTMFFIYSTTLFWVFGLALCMFVGPAQSSSRVIMSRLAPPGHQGQMFGMYATTGRAVSFLAPSLVALVTGIAGADRPGIVAIAVVLAVGLGALLLVKSPPKVAARPNAEVAGSL